MRLDPTGLGYRSPKRLHPCRSTVTRLSNLQPSTSMSTRADYRFVLNRCPPSIGQ